MSFKPALFALPVVLLLSACATPATPCASMKAEGKSCCCQKKEKKEICPLKGHEKKAGCCKEHARKPE